MPDDLFVPRSLEELALEWPKDLDHISASSLKMIVRCPEQWKQRYVLGKRTPPSPELINGRANHQAIEHSMAKKVTSHVDLPVGDVLDVFDASFKKEVEDGGGVGELEITVSGYRITSRTEKSRYVNDTHTTGIRMVGEYHQHISPTVQPIAVEKKFEIQPGMLPVKVLGYIDLLGTDPEMKLPPVIIDRKTGKKRRTKPEPEWVVQAEIYQLVEPVPHFWHVSSPKGTQVDLFVMPRPRRLAELTLDHVVGEIGYFMRRYGPDQPWPAHGKNHPFACNYCGYRPDCWSWKET